MNKESSEDKKNIAFEIQVVSKNLISFEIYLVFQKIDII